MIQSILEIIFLALWSYLSIFLVQAITKNEKGKKYIQSHHIFHPNTISFIRVPVAICAFILYFYGYYYSAIILYTFAVVSDAIDGIIARNCKLETPLWKSLDPLSDKLVYFIPILYFAFLWKFSLIWAIIFIVIDTFWQFSRILLDKLQMETKANIWGKVKTTFVFLFVFYLMILEWKFWGSIMTHNFWIWISIILALFSIIFKFVKSPLISQK